MTPEMLKPRGQTGLEAKNLASASAYRGFGLGLASKLSGLGLEATKRRRTALFGHYRTSSQLPEPSTDEPFK